MLEPITQKWIEDTNQIGFPAQDIINDMQSLKQSYIEKQL